MKRLTWFALAWLALTTAALHAGDTLGIGDPAPKLEVNEFVKGEAVKEFKTGQTYVVEFWATWCGPCRATIPHLSKLQKQYGDKVIFIGVSVFERNQSLVVPFVKEMGEKMEYRVCTDKVGKGVDPDEGPMAKNWMTASGQEGIPTAFVVNGNGKVVWIGHPSQMDKPLEEVVAGTYDLKKATKLFKVQADLRKVEKEGLGAMIKVIDTTIKASPELETEIGAIKFTFMANDKDTKEDDVVKYGNRLINEVFKTDVNNLNAVAWSLVDPDRQGPKPSKTLLALAIKAAQSGVDASKGKDHAVIDTLACAHFANGDKAKAVECIEKAIKLAGDDEMAKEYKARLETFNKEGK